MTFWYGPGSSGLSNRSGCGSGRPNNIRILWIRIRCGPGTMVKRHKKSQNSRNQSFSCYFCLMMKGSGPVLVTNGSECGSGRPKNIRIHNTADKFSDKVLFFVCFSSVCPFNQLWVPYPGYHLIFNNEIPTGTDTASTKDFLWPTKMFHTGRGQEILETAQSDLSRVQITVLFK